MSDPATLRLLAELSGKVAALEALERPRTNYGAANPTGWPTNVPFYRTDLGWWIFYDGTRWLTTQEFTAQIVLSTAAVSATASAVVPAELRSAYAPYITRCVHTYRVATTNDGANFWTIDVRGANAAYSAATIIHTVTTAAAAASTYTQSDAAPSATALPTNRARLDTLVTKSGAPGNITLWTTVFYRLVIP